MDFCFEGFRKAVFQCVQRRDQLDEIDQRGVQFGLSGSADGHVVDQLLEHQGHADQPPGNLGRLTARHELQQFEGTEQRLPAFGRQGQVGDRGVQSVRSLSEFRGIHVRDDLVNSREQAVDKADRIVQRHVQQRNLGIQRVQVRVRFDEIDKQLNRAEHVVNFQSLKLREQILEVLRHLEAQMIVVEGNRDDEERRGGEGIVNVLQQAGTGREAGGHLQRPRAVKCETGKPIDHAAGIVQELAEIDPLVPVRIVQIRRGGDLKESWPRIAQLDLDRSEGRPQCQAGINTGGESQMLGLIHRLVFDNEDPVTERCSEQRSPCHDPRRGSAQNAELQTGQRIDPIGLGRLHRQGNTGRSGLQFQDVRRIDTSVLRNDAHRHLLSRLVMNARDHVLNRHDAIAIRVNQID